jgi:uncharacterized membrane protein YfcA
MVKDMKWVVALAVPAVVCIVYGMVGEDHPVFIFGLVLGIAAYLLFRKKFREEIREKHGERHS